MMLFQHAVRLVLREPGRSFAASVGVAIASTLVTSVLLSGTALTLLFDTLALPGVVLSLVLPLLAAEATADATRRQAAFLRARGATRSQLRTIFIEAAVLTAFAGSALGVVVGAAIGLGLLSGAFGSTGLLGFLGAGAVSIVLTTILASLAAVLSLRTQLSEDVATRTPVRARIQGLQGRAGSAGLLSGADSPRFQAHASVVRARARSRRAGVELGRAQFWSATWQSSEAVLPGRGFRTVGSPGGASLSLAAPEIEYGPGRSIVSAMSSSPSPDRRPV